MNKDLETLQLISENIPYDIFVTFMLFDFHERINFMHAIRFLSDPEITLEQKRKLLYKYGMLCKSIPLIESREEILDSFQTLLEFSFFNTLNGSLN